MKMPHITVTLQSVRYAGQRRRVGDIRVGQRTPSAPVDARIAGILAHTVSQMELVPSVVKPLQ